MQISLQFHEYFLTKNVKIVISRRFEIFDIIVRISTCQKKIQKSILRHTKVYLAASQGLPAMRATRAKEAKILSMTFFSECRKANDGLCRALRRFNFQSSKAFHAPLYSWLRYIQEPSLFLLLLNEGPFSPNFHLLLSRSPLHDVNRVWLAEILLMRSWWAT